MMTKSVVLEPGWQAAGERGEVGEGAEVEASLTIRIRIVNPTSLSMATMVKMMISVKERFSPGSVRV